MISLRNKRFSVCKVLSASPETVWDIITDTRLWPVWGPSLLNVDCNDRYIQLGSEGRVKTLFFCWLPFTVTKFSHMQFWAWNIGPVKATGHTLTQKSGMSCELCFDMAWWAVIYIPVCWLALVKIDNIITKKSSSL
jgi:hypothetical protein